MRVLAVLALALVAAVATAQIVSYQVHSYDDLREWPQVIRKGATWMKIGTQRFPLALIFTNLS
jgi:hypothetical protein